MQQPVALRGRAKSTALFKRTTQTARQQVGWEEPDARNLRSQGELALAIPVKRSTRLITLTRLQTLLLECLGRFAQPTTISLQS